MWEQFEKWLLEKTVWWVKVFITVLCFSVFMSIPLMLFLGVAGISLGGNGQITAWGYAISSVFLFISMPAFMFRTWAGYWPFYSKWKKKRQIRAMNFMPVEKEK